MTSIEWAKNADGTQGHTWNPVRGCRKLSPGCKFCYAETFAERWRGVKGHRYERGFDPRFALDAIDKPLRVQKPTTFFVNSMSDLFLEDFTNEEIAAVFGVMAACPQHTFQVLTKRADRLPEWFSWLADEAQCLPDIVGETPPPTSSVEGSFCLMTANFLIPAPADEKGRAREMRRRLESYEKAPWPLPNVHLGVSVESQKYAEERIPHLLRVPAAVHWISAEPLLGPIDIAHWIDPRLRPRVSWVVVGGESGNGARPFDLAWCRSIVSQCEEAGTAVFVKQFGRVPIERDPDELARIHAAGYGGGVLPREGGTQLLLKDPKGVDLTEIPGHWPRQFPEVQP